MATGVIERRVVREVKPASAMRVAFALSLTVASIALVGLIALFLLAWASGALRAVEGVLASLWPPEAGSEYRLNVVSFLPGFVLVSLAGCGIVAALAGMFAVLYNTLAEIVGGVEVITRDRSAPA